jgi:hypothetical protein
VLFQVTKNLAGFTYALRVQRNVSSTNAATWYVGQTIESFNCQDLAGQTVTFSFYLSAGAQYSGSGVTVQVWTGTGTDEGTTALNSATWTGQTLLLNLTIIPSTTWTKYSYAVPVGAGINEMAVRWNSTTSGTAGAQDSIDISGVQLEPGPVATLYERRLYGTELSLCQRYYYRLTSSGSYTQFGVGVCGSTTTILVNVPLPITMRVPPTAIDYAAVGNFVVYDGVANTTLTGISLSYVGQNSAGVTGTVASGLTQTRPAMFEANGASTAYIGFTAEL